MISYLRGKCLEKSPTSLLLDVHGVGYELAITLSCYQSLANEQEEVAVFTYLSVSENAMSLYGFSDKSERETFLLLISISGIGPKLGQVILSGLPSQELKQAIVSADLNRLKSISGIGKKTAERMIVELKDKIAKMSDDLSLPRDHSDSVASSSYSSSTEEALLALVSLGYKKINAEKIVAKLLKSDANLSVEDIIKQALRSM